MLSRVPLAADTALPDASFAAEFPLSDVFFPQPEDRDTDAARNRLHNIYEVFRREK